MHIIHLIVFFVCVLAFFNIFSKINNEEYNLANKDIKILKEKDIKNYWENFQVRDDFSKITIIERGKQKDCSKSEVL